MKVWKIDSLINEFARKKQDAVLRVVHQGLADGIDVKDIADDLDDHIHGQRQLGRWGYLRPDDKFERAVRDLMDEKGYSEKTARSMAGKQWKAEGKQRLPGSREYYQRFGDAGADFRAIRLIRTEMSVQLNTRQSEIARTNPAVDGNKAEWVLGSARDSWRCDCAANETACKGGKIIGADDYFYNDDGTRVVNAKGNEIEVPPLHPNCDCSCRPVLLELDDFVKKVLGDGGNEQAKTVESR